MYHTIQFTRALVLDLETSPKARLERLLIRRGARRKAQLKPYVVEGKDGPVEVADLFFADDTTARMVSFSCFAFVD
jgi:hypothetical protein